MVRTCLPHFKRGLKMNNQIEIANDTRQITASLLNALKYHFGRSLRNSFLDLDYMYSDLTGEFCEDDGLIYAEYVSHIINLLNCRFENIVFPFMVREIKAIDENDDLRLKGSLIVMRMNVETLFAEYQEGYLLPIYPMLDFKLLIGSRNIFYDFLEKNKNIDVLLASRRDESLLKRLDREKLSEYINSLEKHNLIEIIKGNF